VVVYGTFEPQLLSDQGMPLRGSARRRVDGAGIVHTERPDGSGGWSPSRPPADFFEEVQTRLQTWARSGSPAGARQVTEVVIRMENGVTRTYRRDANNDWSVTP
jgi:hypothetical protein